MKNFAEFRMNKYRIICDKEYLEALKDLFSSPPGFIKENTTRTYMTAPNLVVEVKLKTGEEVLVKSFGWRSLFHFILSPFRRTKAMRSFKTACRLLEHNVKTPEPICVIERRRAWFVLENIYITKKIDNYITVREFLQKQPEGYERARNILPFLAEYVKRLHEAGVWHRDLHLTNFLLRWTPDGEPEFFLIDLNRALTLKRIPTILKLFDIGKMDLHEFRMDFLDHYFNIVKINNREKKEMVYFIYLMFRRFRRRLIRAFLH